MIDQRMDDAFVSLSNAPLLEAPQSAATRDMMDASMTVAGRAHSSSNEDKAQLVWALLEDVPDPELPNMSICDLGIVRGVEIDGVNAQVTITPTYTGCPAMDFIESSIKNSLKSAGFAPQVLTQLSPAWTTDWMRPYAREKLREGGIAAPCHTSQIAHPQSAIGVRLSRHAGIACPRCASDDVEQLSHFGSTACKALYRCRACREPFDYFKPI